MSLRKPAAASTSTPRKARSLSDEQKTEIRDAFDLFDVEKTGQIDYHSLKVAMRALGFEVKKADVLQLMEEHDALQTGSIGYEQFLDICTQRTLARDPDEEMRKAFALFDEDGSGAISLRNMRRVARELGENLSDDELQAMIDEFDTDRDGEINLDEFTSIVRSTTLAD